MDQKCAYRYVESVFLADVSYTMTENKERKLIYIKKSMSLPRFDRNLTGECATITVRQAAFPKL